MDTQSQNIRLYNWLMKGHTITALEALQRFGTLRLAARVWELRQDGLKIDGERVAAGPKTVVRYRLAA